MKLTAILLFIFAMSVSAGGFSQEAKVTLSLKGVRLARFFKEIEKETNYRFAFSDDILPSGRIVNIEVRERTVAQVLKTVLASTKLKYRFVEESGIIIISAKAEETVRGSEEKFVHEISGKVTNEKGEPLSGVTVQVKGSAKATTTGANGAFALELDDNAAILVFSYVGMELQEVNISGKTSVNVLLRPMNKALEEVVVGYGTRRKGEISGAQSSVNVSEMSANASNNVTDALQGRVAGVSVESNGGAPGSSSSITIRGSSTLGSNGPLVVIDGMPFGSLDGLNPSDIQSIEVLKDAAAASIYGSRAAGGVILVTTKLGKRNSTPKFQVNSVYSSQSIAKRMSLLNGEEWTTLFNSNGGGLPAYNGTNTNWQDRIFRTAPVYKVNADVTGGSEHLAYSFSGGYLKQKGTVTNTDFNSANFRAKLMYERSRVKIGGTFIYNKTGGRSLPAGNDQTHSVVRSSLVLPSTVPVYDTANKLGGWGRVYSYMKNLSNPEADLSATHNISNNSNLTSDVFAEVRLFDQLKYKINLGISESRGYGNNYTEAVNDGNLILNKAQLSQNSSYSSSWLIEHTLSYDKRIGLHSFSLLGGFTAQKDTFNSFNAGGNDLPAGLYALSAATSGQSIGGSSSSTTRQSLIGRVSYAFDSRYLLSASIRRDGSSMFASGYQYGVFPSVSLGWNVSNESFYANSAVSRWMNAFKIRGSVGLLGNDQIGNYSTVNTITTNLNFLTNGGMVLGAIPSGTASPANLQWEKTKTTNLGIDAAFLRNKLSLVMDVFEKRSTGILLAVPIPSSAGINGTPTVNAGVVNNKGIEVALLYSDKAGAVDYTIGWNMTAIRNRMTAITIGSGNQEFGNLERAKVGQPLGSFFLIKTAGIFRTDAEASSYVGKNGQPIQPNAKAGDIKFVDYNQDGQIDNNDQQYAGSPLPTLETGLTAGIGYKNFSLNVLVQGTFGNKIYNESRIWMEQMTAYTNLSTAVLQAWTPQNANSAFPRFTLADPNGNARVNSDRWLENGSYVRIKRLELGYTLNDQLAKQLNIDRLRAYISCENLFTFSKYKGYNPDLGNGGNPLSRGYDVGAYPLQRIVSLGLTLSF